MNGNREASPKLLARMVAAGYLVLAVSGIDLFYLLPKFIVRGDAAATAANIQSGPGMFQAGFALEFLGVASYLVVTALLYRLFEPVSRTVSLSAAFFGLTGCVIQAVALILRYGPLLVLGDLPYLSAFQPQQRDALALVLLTAYGQAYNISMVFFAFYLLHLAYLVFRSTFLPRWLGLLLALAVGGLAFAYPPLSRALFPYVMLSSLGEALLILWLGIKGVDERRWHAQAAASGLRD